MKLYRITHTIESASGTQSWTVKAKSSEDALRRHNAGKSEFEFEEIEVTTLNDDPDITEIDE